MNVEIIDREPVDPSLLLRKKMEYMQRYPRAFDVLVAAGVHPDKASAMPNPYLPNSPLDTEDFRNVGRHCVAVAALVEMFAAKLHINPDKPVIRALLHDANKRAEVMRRKAGDASAYTEEGYMAVRKKLAGIVPDELLVQIVASGVESGHSSVKNFIMMDGAGVARLRPECTDEQLLVHLADDMTHSPLPQDSDQNTYFLTPQERMEKGRFTERYPDLYVHGFGFDADANAVLLEGPTGTKVPDAFRLWHVRKYASWQILVSRMIAAELQMRIDPRSKQDPALFMTDIANG